MSTDYALGKSILVSELPRLEKHGIRQLRPEEVKEFAQAMQIRMGETITFFDGTNYMHSNVYDGSICQVERYGGNDAQPLLRAIEAEFRVIAVSEEDETNYGAPLFAQWRAYPVGPCPCCGKGK